MLNTFCNGSNKAELRCSGRLAMDINRLRCPVFLFPPTIWFLKSQITGENEEQRTISLEDDDPPAQGFGNS